MSKEDTPEKAVYPWGTKSGTFKGLIILLAINVSLASVMFVTQVEIPFLQGEKVFDPNMPVGEIGNHLSLICIFIVVINFVFVWFSIRISRWILKIHIECIRVGKKWYCWIFYAIEWIVLIITYVASFSTLAVIIYCWIH